LRQTDILAATVASLSTVIAGLISVYATWLKEKLKTSDEKAISKSSSAIQDNNSKTPEQKMQEHLKLRISEAMSLVQRYNLEATTNKWSNNFLVFGQYIVGVALTSSFLQANLTPTWIGVLGLIVLVTTAVHQRYRPDIKKRVAEAKVALLRSTIRNVQDELSTNENPPVNHIIKRITKTLNRIEIEDSEKWINEELGSETDQYKAKGDNK
jgi:hypothetical protein